MNQPLLSLPGGLTLSHILFIHSFFWWGDIKLDSLWSHPHRHGRSALPVRWDPDQQELRGAAGGTRHLRARG